MFRRGMFFFVVMGAAIGVPYVATEWGKLSHVFSGQPIAATGQPANPAAGAPGIRSRRLSHEWQSVAHRDGRLAG